MTAGLSGVIPGILIRSELNDEQIGIERWLRLVFRKCFVIFAICTTGTVSLSFAVLGLLPVV